MVGSPLFSTLEIEALRSSIIFRAWNLSSVEDLNLAGSIGFLSSVACFVCAQPEA